MARSFIVIGLGLLLVFSILPSSKNPGEPTSTPQPIRANSPEAERRVNAHLRSTAELLEIEKRRTEIENSFVLPQLGASVLNPAGRGRSLGQKEGFDHSGDRRMDALINDIHEPSTSRFYATPEANVQREIARSQEESRELDEEREAFVQQFLANARRNGYEVKLDKEYRVISVRRIAPRR